MFYKKTKVKEKHKKEKQRKMYWIESVMLQYRP